MTLSKPLKIATLYILAVIALAFTVFIATNDPAGDYDRQAMESATCAVAALALTALAVSEVRTQ